MVAPRLLLSHFFAQTVLGYTQGFSSIYSWIISRSCVAFLCIKIFVILYSLTRSFNSSWAGTFKDEVTPVFCLDSRQFNLLIRLTSPLEIVGKAQLSIRSICLPTVSTVSNKTMFGIPKRWEMSMLLFRWENLASWSCPLLTFSCVSFQSHGILSTAECVYCTPSA